LSLPNVLTILRIILTVLFIYLFYQNGLGSRLLALIVFTLASLTDYFDGYLARKYDLITSFGKLMDPIADKFLILSAFFIFMQLQLIAAWMFIAIFAREVIVTGLRLAAVKRETVLAAEGAGKLKTVLQIVAVYLIIILTVLIQLTNDTQSFQLLMRQAFTGINYFMLVVVIVTLWSGFLFIWNNRKEIFYVR